MGAAIRHAIEGMACAPLAGGWSELSPEQRALAAFAHVMANANAAAMTRLIWNGEVGSVYAYRDPLTAMGAAWLGKAIISLVLGARHLMAKTWLAQQCARLERERETLWQLAAGYAVANDLLPLNLVKGSRE